MMRLKPILTLTTAFVALLIGFQNCSPTGSGVEFKSANNNSSASLDSGNPYEGKVYATLGNGCADGSEIHSRIVLTSASEAKLDRDNCQNIKPVQLTTADFQLSADATTLNYRKQDFQYIGRGTFDISNFSFSNDANNFYYSYSYGGQPSFLQIFLDTDNNPATGLSFYGIGADFMIENDNVWKYAAAPGDPQSTFKWTPVVSANKNDTGSHVSWSFSRVAIGSPGLIKLIGHTSLGPKTSAMTQIPQ